MSDDEAKTHENDPKDGGATAGEDTSERAATSSSSVPEAAKADDAPVDASPPAESPTAESEHAEPSEAEVSVAKDPAPPPEAPPRATTDTEGSADALFEALWKRVLEGWDDDKPHVAILEHAMRSEMLPELAGRYRAEKDVPGHEVRAKKKLDGIVIAATQMLMATKTEKPTKTPWQLTVVVALVCVVVLVWVASKVFHS